MNEIVGSSSGFDMSTVSIFLAALLVLLIIGLILISSKYNKQINLKTKIGNNEFNVDIGGGQSNTNQSQGNKPKPEGNAQASENINDEHRVRSSFSNEIYQIAEAEYESNMKELYVNYLEAHIMFTFGFNHIKSRPKEDINDKIYVKLMKRHDFDEHIINKLTWYIPIIKNLISVYSMLYKKFMEDIIVKFKEDFDDMSKIDDALNELIQKNERKEFVKEAINDYKMHNAEIIYYNDENLVDITEDLVKTGKLFEIFEKRLTYTIYDFISDLKMTRMMVNVNSNNPISINSFCVMNRITKIFDFIAKHLCIVYTETKPAVLGDIIDEITRQIESKTPAKKTSRKDKKDTSQNED